MKKILKIVPFLVIAILVGVTVAYADIASFTPPGSVTKTMYSLTGIDNLAQGTTTTIGSGTIPATPAGTPTGTGKTLTEVYTDISSQISSLSNDKIAKGVSAFGFTGTLYGDTDPSKVLTTAAYPGTATAGASAPTWSSADVTSYDCSWFTTMTDPTQPSVTSADICGYNSGCTWSGTSCDNGVQTPSTASITWYAGEAACANSTEGGQTVGTWRLPTYPELVGYYLSSNGTPSGFQSDRYWSGATDPDDSSSAYNVYMNGGDAGNGLKRHPSSLVHCAR